MTSLELAQFIRLTCLEVAHGPHATHIGGSLSAADILAVLYADVMRIDPARPDWEDRDRFVMSKGHSSSALYAALAGTGFITREETLTQYENGTRISGHVSHHVPGIEVSTGALGHGLPIACGMAYAAQLDAQSHRVFCLLGDGELQEGTTWEATLFAVQHNLNNLVIIVDNNRLQSTDRLEDVLGPRDICATFASLGLHVVEVDGHNHDELQSALANDAVAHDAPLCVIAHTTKGKGVSFMENNVSFHSAKIDDSQYEQAISEVRHAG